jgi:hypothetical protein
MHAAAVVQQLMQTYRKRAQRLHMVFVDCSKAFDSVDRGLLLEALEAHGVGPRILRAIKQLYAAGDANFVRGHEDQTFSSTAGVKQGDNMSPVLFVIVLDVILRLAGLEEFRVPRATGDDFLATVFGYADDLVLCHDDPAALQRNIDKLVETLARFGLKVNVKKTEAMSLAIPGQDPTPPTFTAAGQPLAVVQKFTYLGRVVDTTASSSTDITRRVQIGNAAVRQLAGSLVAAGVPLCHRIALINQYCLSGLLYGCETWQPDAAERSKIAAVQTRALRLVLGEHLQVTPAADRRAAAFEGLSDDLPLDDAAVRAAASIMDDEYRHTRNADLFTKAGRLLGEGRQPKPVLEMMEARQRTFALNVLGRPTSLPERHVEHVLPPTRSARPTLYEHFFAIRDQERKRRPAGPPPKSKQPARPPKRHVQADLGAMLRAARAKATKAARAAKRAARTAMTAQAKAARETAKAVASPAVAAHTEAAPQPAGAPEPPRGQRAARRDNPSAGALRTAILVGRARLLAHWPTDRHRRTLLAAGRALGRKLEAAKKAPALRKATAANPPPPPPPTAPDKTRQRERRTQRPPDAKKNTKREAAKRAARPAAAPPPPTPPRVWPSDARIRCLAATNASPPRPLPPPPTSRPDHGCEHCGKRFASDRNATKHRRTCATTSLKYRNDFDDWLEGLATRTALGGAGKTTNTNTNTNTNNTTTH